MEVVETTPETDALIDALTQSVRKQRIPARQCVCYEDTQDGRASAWGLMQEHEHKTTDGWIHILIPVGPDGSIEQRLSEDTAKRCLEGCADEQYVAEDILITHWKEEAPEVEIITAAIDRTKNRVKIEQLVVGRNPERRSKTAMLMHIPIAENAEDIVEMITAMGGKIASRNDRWKQCNQCKSLGHKAKDCPKVMCWHCQETGHRKKQCKGFLHRILVSTTKALPYTVMQFFKAATRANKTYTSHPTQSDHYGEQKSSTFYLEFDNAGDRNQARALLLKVKGTKTFRDAQEFRNWAKHANDGASRLKASRSSSGRSLTSRSRWGARSEGSNGAQIPTTEERITSETTPPDEPHTPRDEDSMFILDRAGLTPTTTNTPAPAAEEETRAETGTTTTEQNHSSAPVAEEATERVYRMEMDTEEEKDPEEQPYEERSMKIRTPAQVAVEEANTEKRMETRAEEQYPEEHHYQEMNKEAQIATAQRNQKPEPTVVEGTDPEMSGEEQKYPEKSSPETQPEEETGWSDDEDLSSIDEGLAAVLAATDRHRTDRGKRTRAQSTPPRTLKRRTMDQCPENPEVNQNQKPKGNQRTIQDCWQ
jgi:hypothetical protein